ncbi:hypothetical protein RUND412_007555 [Rhizina undulata]
MSRRRNRHNKRRRFTDKSHSREQVRRVSGGCSTRALHRGPPFHFRNPRGQRLGEKCCVSAAAAEEENHQCPLVHGCVNTGSTGTTKLLAKRKRPEDAEIVIPGTGEDELEGSTLSKVPRSANSDHAKFPASLRLAHTQAVAEDEEAEAAKARRRCTTPPSKKFYMLFLDIFQTPKNVEVTLLQPTDSPRAESNININTRAHGITICRGCLDGMDWEHTNSCTTEACTAVRRHRCLSLDIEWGDISDTCTIVHCESGRGGDEAAGEYLYKDDEELEEALDSEDGEFDNDNESMEWSEEPEMMDLAYESCRE